MTALELIYYCFPKLVHALRVRGNDNYEEHMELLPQLCQPDKLSLDVGAKTGMYTRRIIECSRDTVAFEPIPVLAHMLQRVFRRVARIERVALSDRMGSAVLRTPFDGRGMPRYGASTIDAENRLSRQDLVRVSEVTVHTMRLDDYAFSDVGFIKIDIEGHEMCVLLGARETLMRERPNLLVEALEENHPGAVEKVREWLSALGYKGFFLRNHELIPIDAFDPDLDERSDGGQNFMFVHEERPDVERNLLDLVTARLQAPDPIP